MARRKTNGVRPPSIGRKLKGKPVEVDLGGTMVPLHFDWEAIEGLENDWGSIEAWYEVVQKGLGGPMFRAVRTGIGACVRDLPVDPRTLMDLARLEDYIEALTAAVMQSGLIPEGAEGNAEGPEEAPSPGSDSSISTLSSSDSAQPSSGP